MSEQLKPAIVRIFNPSDEIVGGGFLVSECHIITCAHVVNLAVRRSKSNTDKPEGEIGLDFPLIDSDQKLKAEVIEWFPPEEFHNLTGKPQDIAVLVEAWPELRDRIRPQRPAINMAEPP